MNQPLQYSEHTGLELAVVGMAGRFPGARDLDQFWDNLRNGVESITFFSTEQVLAAGVPAALANHPDYVRARGALDRAEYFDAAFFGYSPREAQILDPQHRLFLETAWSALENAGYYGEAYPGPVGVFAGAGFNSYLLLNFALNPNYLDENGLGTIFSNDKDFVATRVSYKLDLKGPSVIVQSACSTSLVAVHLACNSLLSGECDLALAGGVTIRVPQETGYLYQEGMIFSPDGHCRSFAAEARGTVAGNGVGVVVLKRLEDALRDGDTIRAIVKSSAINNDGSRKVGYTAPSVDGEARVIRAAQRLAEIDPATITYVEAHGSGTVMGDPIEIESLNRVFAAATDKKNYCGIGSVKSNIGHLDAAAGIAGLIKTVLALEHRELPPSLHCTQTNPAIDFASTAFYVNDRLQPWLDDGHSRRAGVSSFGIGGTNVHVVLEEAPPPPPSAPTRAWQLLPLSAKTAAALETVTTNLERWLAQHPEAVLEDIAYTLQVGRKPLPYRRVLVCQSSAEAQAVFGGSEPARLKTGLAGREGRGVTFLFPGQGAQYPNMGRDLYRTEAVFRQTLDACAERLQPHLKLDLREVLYPPAGNEAEAAVRLQQTALTQPALFSIEYALARQYAAWGLQPQALIGHSIGEYVAACLAGVFTLDEVLGLVATRGRLMGGLPTGAMTAVNLGEQDALEWLGSELSLAAINAPQSCVVSGPEPAVAALETGLTRRGITYRRLHTSHAFHSRMMEPILEAFRAAVAAVPRQPPQRPIVSNLTGAWLTAEEAQSPDYWVSQLRNPVRFAQGMSLLLEEEPERLLLEVGPGNTLSALARRNGPPDSRPFTVSSLRHPTEEENDVAFLLGAVGSLWLAGSQLDWQALHGATRRRLPLPTYPFEGKRYWLELSPGTEAAAESVPAQPTGRWWLTRWSQAAPWPVIRADAQARNWLLLLDKKGTSRVLGNRLQELLQQRGSVVIEARPGSHFQQLGERLFQLRPGVAEDYLALWYSLSERDLLPDRLVHLWGLGPYAHPIPPQKQTGLWAYLRRLFGAGTDSVLEGALQRGYFSLLGLAAAQQQLGRDGLRIGVVTDGIHNILGREQLLPVKATVLAAGVRLEREYPALRCQCIDVIPAETSSRVLAWRLIAELDATAGPVRLAYRDDGRWTQDWIPLAEETVDTTTAPLRREGVYLITGGFSATGLALARYLAQTSHARLILPTTVALPPRRHWDGWLAEQPADDPAAQCIQSIRELEALGAQVLNVVAESNDIHGMTTVLQRSRERWRRLDGVIWGIENLTAATVADPGSETRRLAALQVCNRLLGETELDFVILLNPVTAGRLPDNTAGALADAIAQARRRRANWVSVQSAPWRTDPADNTGLQIAEGIAALVQILGRALPQALISSPPPTEAAVEPASAITPKAGLHQRPALANVYYPPTTELQAEIASLWQDLFAISPIGIHDNFFDLGGDSMLAIQLVARLQEHFQVELPLAEVLQHPTVAEQSATIQMIRQGGRSHQSPIVTIQPAGEQSPFFCIHPAGGIVHCYVELARLLDKGQPFLALQHPGIDGNPAPYSTFEAMATHYLAAIREVQPHGPYYLGGWSFGGTVAFEIAQRLLVAGETVALLAMLDTPAPTTVGGMALRPAFDAAGIFVFMARSIGAVFGSELNISYEQLKDLTPAEQFDYVLTRAVRSQDAQALAQGREQLARIIELFKLSDIAERSYIPRPYPGRITMLRVQSMDDYEFTGYKNHPQLHNSTFGWDALSTQPVEVHQVPGTHMTMVAHPYVQVVAATLQQVLTRAQADSTMPNHTAQAAVHSLEDAALGGTG